VGGAAGVLRGGPRGVQIPALVGARGTSRRQGRGVAAPAFFMPLFTNVLEGAFSEVRVAPVLTEGVPGLSDRGDELPE
jgi:hypothetical protein